MHVFGRVPRSHQRCCQMHLLPCSQAFSPSLLAPWAPWKQVHEHCCLTSSRSPASVSSESLMTQGTFRTMPGVTGAHKNPAHSTQLCHKPSISAQGLDRKAIPPTPAGAKIPHESLPSLLGEAWG